MNVILGGGIAGLIWAKYHPDHFILTDQVGGQMMSYFDLGPRYLHNKSKYVESFLKDLDVPLKLSTIKVGYLDDSGFVNNPSIEFRLIYFMKSRGQTTIEGFDPTVLNTNVKEFQVCDVDFKELINKLYDKLEKRIYLSPISSIDLKENNIKTDGASYKYNKLVSTIPLNVFSRISKLDLQLKSYDMAYCLLSSDFFDIRRFDYVYDARTTTCFHRLTKCKQGIVCDVFGSKVEEFKEILLNKYSIVPKVDAIHLVKNSQIISLDKDFKIEGKEDIKFVGRYGAWSRRYKTETVIEEAIVN